jgi:hypothetical protein
MRTPVVLLTCSTLVACSIAESLPPIQPYVLPSMPTTEALVTGVKQAAAEAHLIAPLEMSDLRPTDHGPGHFMLCMRGVSNDYRTGFYAVFFDDKYKGSRLPVIFENCEKQNYRPVP